MEEYLRKLKVAKMLYSGTQNVKATKRIFNILTNLNFPSKDTVKK